MKKTILTLLSVLFCAITFAQNVPQGINYQALARDTAGAELANDTLIVQFSVLEGAAISWQEIDTVTTNEFGLFTTIIGGGTSTSNGSSSTFDLIDWGAAAHSLKVEIDYGNGYLDMGTTDFMSVPYSLHAKTAANGITTDELQSLRLSGDTLFIEIQGSVSSGNWIILPTPILLGCTDLLYTEYNPLANTNDGSCATLIVNGCTDSTAFNYNALANTDDGSCAYAIGDNYQGGIIFYIFQLGDAGYVAGQVHGLIAAPTDQSSDADDVEWGCYGTNITGTSTTLLGNGSISVEINTGFSANDCYFTITDSSGAIVTQGGQGGAYSDYSTYFNIYCLPQGTYTFNWYDIMTHPWYDGTYTISNPSGSTIITGSNSAGSGGSVPFSISTACSNIYGFTGADGIGIGTGAQNTIDIVNANCSPYNSGNPIAANICDTLTLGGYSDWFLPSKDELNAMYSNIGQGNVLGLGTNVGGFPYTNYWNSSEYNNTRVGIQRFGEGGTQVNSWKNGQCCYNVRAVRAF
jgi:hypothetical protein